VRLSEATPIIPSYPSSDKKLFCQLEIPTFQSSTFALLYRGCEVSETKVSPEIASPKVVEEGRLIECPICLDLTQQVASNTVSSVPVIMHAPPGWEKRAPPVPSLWRKDTPGRDTGRHAPFVPPPCRFDRTVVERRASLPQHLGVAQERRADMTSCTRQPY